MTPQQMLDACAKSINSATEAGLPIDGAQILLVFPRGVKRPEGFPKGKLATVNFKGERVVYFKAVAIMKWLVKNGCEIHVTPK
jgi:hypothetical protein